MNPLLYIDFYKASHREQYPENTTLVYSNFTPRKSRVPGSDKMVFFGLQAIIKKFFLWDIYDNFFYQDKYEVVGEYVRLMQESVNPNFDGSHLLELHDLQYLPLRIKAVPEGTHVPMGTPCMTFWNTHPQFYWLTNYLETLISAELWKPCTSATTAMLFRALLDKYAHLTGANPDIVPYQGHDFSFRGMSSVADACSSGAGHLLSFYGTDTVPAIEWLKEHYDATGLIGRSVQATEHSVMCAGGEVGVMETFTRLLDIYPTGVLSVVSGTWDFWKVITEILPTLKDEILSREGKLVIRPDSGIPSLIINGDPDSACEAEKMGLVRLLARTFGWVVNGQGYKSLNSKVGFIYGDGIDYREATKILAGLEQNGYCTDCCVLGLGSYTYQYCTRDTYGTVCKATYCEVDGVGRSLFKSPKTGAWKTSHRGLLRVNEDLTVSQDVSWLSEAGGILETVFLNGNLIRSHSLNDIRRRIKS